MSIYVHHRQERYVPMGSMSDYITGELLVWTSSKAPVVSLRRKLPLIGTNWFIPWIGDFTIKLK